MQNCKNPNWNIKTAPNAVLTFDACVIHSYLNRQALILAIRYQ